MIIFPPFRFVAYRSRSSSGTADCRPLPPLLVCNHEEDRSRGLGRVPVRGGALPCQRNARHLAHLPLPHVPKGGGQLFRGARWGTARRAPMDAGQAGDFQELRSRRTRLLSRLRDAAILSLSWRSSYQRNDGLPRRARTLSPTTPIWRRGAPAMV